MKHYPWLFEDLEKDLQLSQLKDNHTENSQPLENTIKNPIKEIIESFEEDPDDFYENFDHNATLREFIYKNDPETNRRLIFIKDLI